MVVLGGVAVSYERGTPLSRLDMKVFKRWVCVSVYVPSSSATVLFFFFSLVTGPRRSLRLKMSDTRVYEPQIRARLGTTAHFCEVVPQSRPQHPARRFREEQT